MNLCFRLSSLAMATFQVHYCDPLDLNQPSTSYLHLSGYSSTKNGKQIKTEDFIEEDEEEGEDQVMNDQDTDISAQRLATTGQAIASATTFMRGHGAYLAATSSQSSSVGTPMIHSSLCGVIHKTNKLISVSSLKSRYSPEVGDLVIGRITDLQPGNKRWKVDIQSRQDSNLLLSSINLPGGIQRRKLESDELEMRSFFKEGDLVVAEIQNIFTDGSTNLHTRSLNYGKLRNGQVIIVNATLITRLKSHFVRMDAIGLEIVIGLNGVIWVSVLNEAKVNVTTGTGRDIEAVYSDHNDVISSEIRRRISRMLDIIAIFSSHHLPITDVALMHAYDVSTELVPLELQDVDMDHALQVTTLTSETMAIIVEQIRKAMN
jgi:exosome complex component RRP4